jgi:hypothetical protein
MLVMVIEGKLHFDMMPGILFFKTLFCWKSAFLVLGGFHHVEIINQYESGFREFTSQPVPDNR